MNKVKEVNVYENYELLCCVCVVVLWFSILKTNEILKTFIFKVNKNAPKISRHKVTIILFQIASAL